MQRFTLFLVLWCAGIGIARAQVTATDPWVRATVPGQEVAVAYVQLAAPKGARLVAARTPAAKLVEVHEMVMDGDMMRMRRVPELVVPAGKPLSLAPGGLHFMLIGIRKPMKVGAVVPLELEFESDGRRQAVKLQAPVRPVMESSGGGHAGHGAK